LARGCRRGMKHSHAMLLIDSLLPFEPKNEVSAEYDIHHKNNQHLP
jgi:hypothetical protein